MKRISRFKLLGITILAVIFPFIVAWPPINGTEPKKQKVEARLPMGYPSHTLTQQAYGHGDLERAIQVYKIFYPSVSGLAIIKGNQEIGILPNKVFGLVDTQPRHIIFTANSDTPYGPILLDLKQGPIVIELPAGPLITMAMDIHQNWVADMGLPGPDQGKGGRHLLLPPHYKGTIPSGYHVWKSTSNRMIAGVRSLPVNGDVKGAFTLIQKIKVYPLYKRADWKESRWEDKTAQSMDTTPLKWENNIKYWEALNEIVQDEPIYENYRAYYGELAVLGIVKGKPFSPSEKQRKVLEQAARMANNQMRVESFADRRSDRLAWNDRKWEWASLRYENADFVSSKGVVDLEARDKWFYQAIGASPAMFRRDTKAGSLYWLGTKEKNGAFLDGGKTYKLRVPQPVPGKLFWSVTVYDTVTRSQIQTGQGKAALRSMFELKDMQTADSIELYFGPQAPAGKENQWIRTIPGKGWFTYFRIYGPQEAAFNGNWKPGDFEEVSAVRIAEAAL